MLGQKDLERLRIQKQALVAESSLNRLALRQDWGKVEAALSEVARPAQIFRSAAPWLLLAPVAGFFLGRRPRRQPSTVGFLRTCLTLAQAGFSIWRYFADREGSRRQAGPD